MNTDIVVIAVVDSELEADNVMQRLSEQGFAGRDISAVMPDRHGIGEFAHEQNTKAPEGAVLGGTSGGLLGGALGLMAGIGALALPGLGPFIAAGPLMAALSGAAAGAAVGGITGALVGMGIPEIEAKFYESRVRDGDILLAVRVDDAAHEERATQIFRQLGAHDVVSTSEASVTSRREPSTTI